MASTVVTDAKTKADEDDMLAPLHDENPDRLTNEELVEVQDRLLAENTSMNETTASGTSEDMASNPGPSTATEPKKKIPYEVSSVMGLSLIHI